VQLRGLLRKQQGHGEQDVAQSAVHESSKSIASGRGFVIWP
jgi:hypothetical protein